MDMHEEMRSYAAEIGGELKEKKGSFRLRKVIAERKAFLSRRKLEYIASFRLDDQSRRLKFSEMLKETGSGVTSGLEGDMSPGFGFRKESYRTSTGPREGSIDQQANLLGKKYDYSFDFREIRGRFEEIAADNGYTFEYSVTGKGI